jgi:hypothetical protein
MSARNQSDSRKLLNDWKCKKLDKKGCRFLQGNLAFVLDVEPRFYSQLCQKYGAGLLESALRQRGDHSSQNEQQMGGR